VLNSKKEQTFFYAKKFKKLFIPSDNKMVEFEFGMPDYNFPEKCMFAYKLVGIDKDWIQLGNRNYLRLSELKAGDYTLMVKACNSKGIWYAMQNNLQIEVDGPFYTKWWFITLLVLLVVGSGIVFYRIRIFQLKKLLALRLQISSDLHDEVGSILTAVGMQAELLQLKNKHKQPELIQISETSRKAVSNMRDVIWSIDTRNDSVKDLIDRMHEYLSSLFDSSNLYYSFNKSVANPNQTIDLITRQNTYLIFKEAINNIAKHANATQVSIDLVITASHIKLEIINNGKPKPVEKRGMGLSNMEMRAQKMKASLFIDTDNNYRLLLMKRF
jgi:signal transduction histidine kinase